MPKGLDEKKIADYVFDRLAKYASYRREIERQMFTSILFSRGEQWVRFAPELGTFRRRNMRRAIPRPITNKFTPTCNSIQAALTRYNPRIVIAPETDTPEDVASAPHANKIIKTIENEADFYRHVMPEVRAWLVYTGNAFTISGFDRTKGTTQTFMKMKCLGCATTKDVPVTPEEVEQPPQEMCEDCAGRGVVAPFVPEIDGRSGRPKLVNRRSGRIATEVNGVFNMFFDNSIPRLDDQPIIMRAMPKDIDWIEQTFGVDEDTPGSGIVPGKLKELNARIQSGLSSFHFPLMADGGDGATKVRTADIVECWCKPSDEFPVGFYAVFLHNRKALHIEPYGFLSKRGEPYYPIVHFQFDVVPGSMLARTPAFDLIEKQKLRNRVEALGEMILMRMSNPVWLKPTGTTNVFSGEAGQVIEYDPNISGGHAPGRLEGSQLPASIPLWLQQIDRDFAEISGQYEVARGERPLSVRSGPAIAKLQEISESRNSTLFDNYAHAIARWQIINFEIFRAESPTDRYYRVLGDEVAWSAQKVKDSDLLGGVDIWAEQTTGLPKTHIERLVTLETFLTSGLLDLSDPRVRMRLFREYGMTELLPQFDADYAAIAREHDRLKSTGRIARNPFDNDLLHVQQHLDLAKSEWFEGLAEDDPRREALYQNIIEHLQSLQAPDPLTGFINQVQVLPPGTPIAPAQQQPQPEQQQAA